MKCYEFYPPQYMREIEGAESGDLQCVFCKRGKDYVMLVKEGSSDEKYTKKQCIRDYKMFLKKLKESPNIAKKLTKGKT